MADECANPTARQLSVVAGRRHRVVIAGGGVAALETVLALRALAGDHVSLALLTPEAELMSHPVTVAEAFGRAEARTFRIDEILLDQRIERVRDTLAWVDPAEDSVVTTNGARLDYDSLMVGVGARQMVGLPGALSFRGCLDVPALRQILDDLVAGTARSVAFALPGGHPWPVPIYELALLTADHLREQGSQARVTLVTPEERPLALFGPAAEQVVAPMLSSLGVVLRCSALALRVRRGELLLAGGGGICADRVVTLTTLRGPCIPGLPADAHGFIPVDANGRVHGVRGAFAAGDVTTFPLKQCGLAAQQADAAAAQIAHEAGAPVEPQPFAPVLRSLLVTAGAPVYLRCEPQRLARPASVAIDDRRSTGHEAPPEVSVASDQALWWPPAKITGRYLAPHLATARPLTTTVQPLTDRQPEPGPGPSAAEFADAVELALMLADCDADWGNYQAAVASLDAAQALQGTLPAEYEVKRALWLREVRAEH